MSGLYDSDGIDGPFEKGMARVMYEVAILEEGKVMIGGGCNNPCEGLLSLKRRWTRITKRPVGLARAKALADAQPGKAVVCVWGSSEKAHDNGKRPIVPAGWWSVDAVSAFDPKPAVHEKGDVSGG